MTGVVLPALVRIQLADRQGHPLAEAGIVLGIRFRARAKNDYHLSPFVSDAAGVVEITGARCEAYVEAEHASGLMDYAGLAACEPVVEIRVWDRPAIEAVINARETTWTRLLPGEDRYFDSITALLDVYRSAPKWAVD